MRNHFFAESAENALAKKVVGFARLLLDSSATIKGRKHAGLTEAKANFDKGFSRVPPQASRAGRRP